MSGTFRPRAGRFLLGNSRLRARPGGIIFDTDTVHITSLTRVNLFFRSSRLERPKLAALRGLVALAVAFTSLAVEHRGEVVPAPDLPFNYPDPPREGAADFFPIASKGRARCMIVQPAMASSALQSTVRALQAYLKLVTGADIPVVTEGTRGRPGLAAIHVGDTARARAVDLGLPELRYGADRFPNLSGYLIKTLDRRTLLIRGTDDRATAHGVVGFLKRYAGVRQYWPGPPGGLGDVVPSRPTLTVPEVEWRDWPYFFSATFSTRVFSGDKAGNLDFYRRRVTLPCNENYSAWLPPAKYAATRPEWYPLINGVRGVPSPDAPGKSWQPCVSNPDVPRIMGDAVVEYFQIHPAAVGVNFALNDGGGDCTCAHCQALDAPPDGTGRGRGMSDRYMRLTNKVCERLAQAGFPGKWLVYLAYGAARDVPRTVKPHPRVLPVLTVPGNTFQAWDDWLATGVRHLGLYVHHNDAFFVLPKFDLHQMARRLQYAVGSGRARVFYMELHAQWPFGDVIPYVTAELLWDPRRDVEALLDEYYTGFYGPAAQPMRAFHEVLEAGYNRWLAENGRPHGFGKDISSLRDYSSIEQFRVLSPEEAALARVALEQAAARVPPPSREGQRIDLVRRMFHLQDLAVQWAWAAFRLLESEVGSLAGAERAVEDARQIYRLSAEISNYITDTLEKPPLAAYRLFCGGSQPPLLYQALKSGEPPAEVRGAINLGLNAAADRTREALGAKPAAAWWRARCNQAKDPALLAALRAAAQRAGSPELTNLLTDPGFEATVIPAGANELDLPYDTARRLGIHHWFPERSPGLRYTVSTGAHSGRRALSIERAQRCRFSRSLAPVVPGARYRVSVWFRHNEGEALYRFAVSFRLTDDTYPEPVLIRIPHRPGRWQELSAEITAPPRARVMSLRVYVNNQAADARCWIDDAFIGKYPD